MHIQTYLDVFVPSLPSKKCDSLLYTLFSLCFSNLTIDLAYSGTGKASSFFMALLIVHITAFLLINTFCTQTGMSAGKSPKRGTAGSKCTCELDK